jgi:hypothetical protein
MCVDEVTDSGFGRSNNIIIQAGMMVMSENQTPSFMIFSYSPLGPLQPNTVYMEFSMLEPVAINANNT